MTDNTNTPVLCDKPAAFYVMGLGHGRVMVCLDCFQKAQQISSALGCPLHLDPDVPEGAKCQQKKRPTQ